MFKLRFLAHFTLVLVAALTGTWRVQAASSFAVIGDAGKANDRARMVLGSILQRGVSKVVLPGDNLYGPISSPCYPPWLTYESVWDSWKQRGISFVATAIGNHTRGYKAEMKYFNMPAEYYSTVVDGVRFIVLNSDNSKNVQAQAAFLDTELTRATEKLIFLVYHHPSYLVTYPHWTWKKKFTLATRPLIWKHRSKITALLVGHDHIAAVMDFDGLPSIVSGAAQSAHAAQFKDEYQDGVHVRTQWRYNETRGHWALLETNPESATARVHFIDANTNTKECSARLTTGSPAELEENCSRSGPTP